MEIQYQFTVPTTDGGSIRLFADGNAIAENWCAEFSDWQIDHITIESVSDADGQSWPLEMFSPAQFTQIRIGLLIAAHRKSAMNPTLAANLRKILDLPAFEAKPDYI